MDREMTAINMAGQTKTYALPRSVTAVVAFAFQNKRQLQSVVLNEGLERLEPRCFEGSQIRKLVLPSSVTDVGFSAFANCESLRSADLSAARGLKKLGDMVFGYRAELGDVLY